MPRNIVRGQPISSNKKQLARELRRQMTPAERVLWHALRANRLRGLQFRRQQVIVGYIADFYCHAAGLVIEVDGSVHAEQAEYDAERDKAIALYDLQVIRFTNDEVLHALPSVLNRIEATIDEINASMSERSNPS